MTTNQLSKIANQIKEHSKNTIKYTVNKSNTTTSAYINLTVEYIDRFNDKDILDVTVRFSNHGIISKGGMIVS